MRQKHLALTAEKYLVWDEEGRELLYVERPFHSLQSLGALFAALTAAAVVGGGFGWLASIAGDPVNVIFGILAFVGGLGSLIVVAHLLSPYRHLTFYASAMKGEPILRVMQDQKAIIVATFTVLDAQGRPIAKLRKNHLWNFIRRKWEIYTPDGALLALAMEDSMILAILRRFLGTLYGILRTNFVIEAPDGAPLGRLDRKFTLLDRYVLDVSADVTGHLDRRIALAMGVMLDTGERR